MFGNDSRLRPQSGIEKLPGPGQYSNELPATLNKYRNNSGFRFSKEKKCEYKIPKDIPGPSEYMTKENFNTLGGKFGREAKLRLTFDNEIPGPGCYDIPHSIPSVPKHNYPQSEKRKIAL